jgi:hypothetical protein
MSQYPQRVVLHQQLGSQLQTQLKGLRAVSRRLRLTVADVSQRVTSTEKGQFTT